MQRRVQRTVQHGVRHHVRMATMHGQLFTAGDAARACGVARTTISRAAAAGRIAGAERDEAGAWVLPLSGLLAAGFNPGKPSPPEDEKPHERDDVLDRVRQLEAELAVQHVRTHAAEALAAERAERIVDLRQALRQLEQGESSQTPPESPQAAEQAEPIPTHTPGPVRPSTGKWRKALNVIRYG